MGIDWEKTQPNPQLDDLSKSLVRDIAEQFLNTGTAVADHAKRVHLGKNRHLLNSLVQRQFITNIGNKFYPAFAAVYYLPPELRECCEVATAWVLKAFQALYKVHGPQTFKIADVSDQIDRMASRPLGAEAAPLGMLFARDFPNYFSPNFEYSRDAPITVATAWDNILDFENLQQAWQEEFARRNPPVLKNPTSASPMRQPERSGEAESKGSTDKLRKVFVVHGRDEKLRSGVFTFLRSLGLEPLEWTKAIRLTGNASPYIGQILDAAFAYAQAVVVLLTPDDLAKLREDLLLPDDPIHERTLTGQARPNVLFEAGMAFASHPDQTVLVQFGNVRPFSDVAGRHIVKMDNSPQKRHELASKLETAGCSVDMSGNDWQSVGDLTSPSEPVTKPSSPVAKKHSEKDSAPPPSPKEQPKRNFQFVGSRTVDAHAGEGDGQIYESPDGLGDFLVSIVCFRNDAIVGEAIQQPYLSAHIIYKDRLGQEITDVPRGVWLNHYGEAICFETGKKRCLIIMLLSKQSTLMKVVNESYTHSQSWMVGGPSFRIRQDRLSTDVASVEVNLLGEDTCFLRAVFDVTQNVSGGLPTLSLRSISES